MLAAGANVYVRHDLVSDQPGVADVTDPNLVNPWGVSFSAMGPFWVSNTGKGNSTLYNGSGAITPTVVTVPAAAAGKQGTPTGQVFNGGTGFLLANGNQLLYAPNFTTGNIDVYDSKWTAIKVSGGFTDPSLPEGFAPFNIWQLRNNSGVLQLYVAYAKQGPLSGVTGAGSGYVAVFDFDGNLQKHLISGGPLNAPWGLAIAPSTFGAFGGSLLVGNFGDGTINAFDANTGAAQGTLQGTDGNPIVFSGLWAPIFGIGATAVIATRYTSPRASVAWLTVC